MTESQVDEDRILLQTVTDCHYKGLLRSSELGECWLNISARWGSPAGISRARCAVDESVAVQLLLELAPLLCF